jgi:tetratricopeptide (TPR) repeat protein
LARLRRLAETYSSQGRFALAAARLDEALGRFPENDALLVELGQVRLRAGDYDAARHCFHAVLARDENCVAALDGLATIAESLRAFADARAYLKRIIVHVPQAPDLWIRIGDAENRLGNRHDAVAAWLKALAVDPQTDAVRDKVTKRLRAFSSGDPTRGETSHQLP